VKPHVIYSFTDESYDPAQTSGYVLSVRADYDRLSFAILDASSNQYVLLKVLSFNPVSDAALLAHRLDDIITQEPCLNAGRFKDVYCSPPGSGSVLVPAPLFSREHLASYYDFSFEHSQGESLHADHLNAVEGYNVYAVSNLVEHVLLKHFHSIHVRHFTSSLIGSVMSENKNMEGQKVCLHTGANTFEMLVVSGKTLRFYNSFKYRSPEDFMYYALFSFEQLGINPEVAEVVLLGEIEKSAAIYAVLNKYIRNIRFGKRPSQFGFSKDISELPGHFYYSLFALPASA
jgi:hypothetical protein